MALLSVIVTVFYFAARNKPIQSTVIVMIWSLFLFLVTTINMLTLAYLVLGGWEDFQAMPVMGTFQLILVTLKSLSVSLLDALLCWAWSMCIGISVSKVGVFFVLLNRERLWPFYPIVGTSGFALLITALKISLQNHQGEEESPLCQ